MFKSATFKLTMWYLAIVMVISLGFSAALYHFATDELSFGLEHQTQRIFRRYPVFTNDPNLQVQGNDVDQGSHRLLLQLVYFNFLVLVGAGLASYWLAQRTLEPIEAAHERQKRFTADVSHELRTPLTSLKMGSEVALMDPQANKTALRDALASNVEDATKMELLINNLLRLTKLDADESKSQFITTDTTTVVTAALEQVSKLAEQKHIKFENTVQRLSLQADPATLTQLLVILLDNAIKYSPEKSKVTLDSKQTDSTITLQVKDEGKGIAPEALPHIFDRFYRADKSRTKSADEGQGFGLGLSIAKMIAERHDGSITITSRPGKGTTVSLSLPQRQEVGTVSES